MLFLAFWVALPQWALSQSTASFPLEGVKISGSLVPAHVVMEIGGLKLGQSLNKEGIEAACQKLGQSGIFEDVSYAYAPGPQKGYLVTLQLTDPKRMVEAVVDLPGADEGALWAWISGQFPQFQHKVPPSEEAQQYVASLLERKLGDSLHGEHVVTRVEQDYVTKRSLVSFQMEHLPSIAEMKFDGASRVPQEELSQLMHKLLGDEGYTERRFRGVVEEAVRQDYEQHGMFKVQFPRIEAKAAGPNSVSVNTTIVEGVQYKLADVQIVGDDLPKETIINAAKFKTGEIANWRDIQQGIFRSEVPVKRTGYMQAQAVAERVLDDANQSLVLKLGFRKGALYRFGQVRFVGLNADLQAKAIQLWQMRTGDAFDYLYPRDFFQKFPQVADLRMFKKIDDKAVPGVGDHVMDVVVTFQGK